MAAWRIAAVRPVHARAGRTRSASGDAVTLRMTTSHTPELGLDASASPIISPSPGAPGRDRLGGRGLYDLIPNYGVAIILLTMLIRLVLLPLGIKQVRSMQHMQIVQPKIKQIQQKYKGNKQRQQEEIMKLYKEYGVNPFSGCWPVLLQFPILIAMYSVLRWPQHPIHVPTDSGLYAAVSQQIPETLPGRSELAAIETQAQIDALDLPGPTSGTSFLGMNLSAPPFTRGTRTPRSRRRAPPDSELEYPVNCGSDVVDRIPVLRVRRADVRHDLLPAAADAERQPARAPRRSSRRCLKLMPILFGVFGIFFPAGLVLYWTTSNAWQIGQQYFMLKSRPTAEQMAERAKAKPQKVEKKGFMASMMERAEQQRQQRGSATKPGAKKPGSNPKPGQAKGSNPSRGQSEAGVESEAVRVRRQRQWRRSEEAPQALRRPSRPPSASSA